MKKVKIIIKRPWTHYAISGGYIVSPLVNIGLLILIANIPLSLVIQRLFQGYGYLASIWMLSAPLVGIGLYFVHKVSWYLFLAHSSLILVDYILKWATKPIFYWRAVPELHQFLILSGNLVLVLIIGFIIRKDFRSPYFQVLQRGWRVRKRCPIRHRITLNGEIRSISDMSKEGCFVSEPDIGLKVADKVTISFQGEALTIECKGEIMRSTPDGFGVRFFSLSAAQKRDISRMLKTLFAVRYDVDLSGYWLLNGQRLTTKVVDISDTGCYLQADVSGIDKGAEGTFEVQNRRRRHLLPGAIVWVNNESSHEKPAGFGVHFAKNQRGSVKKIVAHYGTGKLIR